jgi:glycosyltransferase involved in cell wall biosynthesis
MRIGIVTTSYPRAPTDPAGGFVAGLARWLAARGAAVDVVAAGPGADRDGAIAIHRVDGRHLFYGDGAPAALAASFWARVRAPWFAARLLRAAARLRPVDLWISHWLVPCAVAVETLRPRRGPPHLAIAHGSDVRLLEQLRPLACALGRSSARLVFVSGELRARFAALSGRPTGVVCAMATEEVSTLAPPAGRFTALFLGRLVPQKGPDLFLAAARALAGVDFLLAGDGPCAFELRTQAPPNLRLLGVVSGAAKQAALAAAHVVCVPSRGHEGSPVVIAEARAAGRPVVGANVGGIPEAIGAAGLIVPPNDAGALVAALARLRADPELYARMRAACDPAKATWPHVGPRLLSAVLPPAARDSAFLRWLSQGSILTDGAPSGLAPTRPTGV